VRALKAEHKDLASTDNSVVAVTFDLEQVLQCPSLNAGALYYKRKLSVYNQTVYNLADHSVHCYVWHEGSGGRGSCEMASCLYKYISALSSDVQRLILYSDTCGGQNRNINFSSMCLYATTHLPITTIDHVYMESGHSQMECDSVHSTIEKATKSVPVYVPMDYFGIIRGAWRANKYEVHPMSTEFLNFKEVTKKFVVNRSKAVDGTVVNWLKMKWIRYDKNEPGKILFKYDYDAEFNVMVVNTSESMSGKNGRSRKRRARIMPAQVKPLFLGPVSISDAKYADLQSLCQSRAILTDYHSFYASLAHTAANATEGNIEPSEDE
jgi:hypothetical protein